MMLLNPKQHRRAYRDERSRELMLRTIDFFERKGKRRLKADDHARVWYADFLEFVKQEGIFHDYAPVFAGYDLPNVALFVEQIAAFRELMTAATPDEAQRRDLDFLMALGEIFVLIVYAEVCVAVGRDWPTERLKLIEYDTATNTFVSTGTPFVASPLQAGIPVPQRLASPVDLGSTYVVCSSLPPLSWVS